MAREQELRGEPIPEAYPELAAQVAERAPPMLRSGGPTPLEREEHTSRIEFGVMRAWLAEVAQNRMR